MAVEVPTQQINQTDQEPPFGALLGQAINRLEAAGIDYRIVGSLGIYAQIPSLEFNPLSRHPQSASLYRDIDFIFANNQDPAQEAHVKRVCTEFNNNHSQTTLEANLSYNKWIMLTDDEAYLAHRGLKVRVPLGVFRPVEGELSGVTLKTLPLSTLFNMMAMYSGGVTRSRDRQIEVAIGRVLEKDDLNKDFYEGFGDFYSQCWRRFPIEMWKAVQYGLSPEDRNPFYKAISQIPEPARLLLSRLFT